MKIKVVKLIVVFIVVIVSIVLIASYFLKGSKKSKASSETVTFSFSPNIINQTSGEFTTEVKIKPSGDMFVRGYEFKVKFDKDVLELKDIQYDPWNVTTDVGDDNSKISFINENNGIIKVVGEDRTSSGNIVTSSEETKTITLKFNIKKSDRTLVEINTDLTNRVFKIDPDYTLISILSAGRADLNINQQIPTDTPFPTPTYLPTPTLIPTSSFTPIPSPTVTPFPTYTEIPTLTPTPSFTPTPSPTTTPSSPTTTIPTPTISLGCQCISDVCLTDCLFDYNDQVISYIKPPKCSLSANLFSTPPTSEEKQGWCKTLRVKGDADGNGVVDNVDYLYYVAVVFGGKIPAQVNPDFNGDGNVGRLDLDIYRLTMGIQ